VWEDYFSPYHETEEYTKQETENLIVVRVPYKWGKAFQSVRKSPVPQLVYWFQKLKGNFHIETDACNALKEAAVKVLSKGKFDFIIVTSPPLNVVRLGVGLKKQFDVPLVIDFRDSFNNHLLNPAYKPGLKFRAEGAIFRYYLKKWLAQADLIVGVSQPVLDTLPLAPGKRQLIVMNGYGDDVPNREHFNTGKFTISYIGSLYAHQEIEFMAEGLSAFLKEAGSDDIMIRFIGVKAGSEVHKKITKFIDPDYLFFSDRVLRNEALEYMAQSEILLQVGWPGYKGLIPGKVFEYMAARRNILVAPGDGELTDTIIKETGAGVSVSSKEEMTAYLRQKYAEWKAEGRIAFHGTDEEISKYSRKSQNEKLLAALAEEKLD
jgi:hypothetical protein